MVQEGPTVETDLWFGWPGGQFREKQWQEEHLAVLILGDYTIVARGVAGQVQYTPGLSSEVVT